MLEDYGVMEFCVIGSQVPPVYMLVPFRYGKEDGSDGVVRVSSCNVNVNYLRIGPTDKGMIQWADADKFANQALAKMDQATRNALFDGHPFAGDYYETKQVSIPDTGAPPENIDDHRPVVPFAIPYETCHSDAKMGVVSGTKNREQVLACIKNAFSCNSLADYHDCIAKFQEVTDVTYAKVANPDHKKNLFASLTDALLKQLFQDPQGQYDGHSQIVLRVRDQNGHAINDYSVYFNSYGGDGEPNMPIDDLFEDKHQNNKTPNVMNFYLRTRKWNGQSGTWEDRVPHLNGIDLEIDVLDSAPDRILFIPMRMRIPDALLVKFLQPHRTTIIDVELMRLPSNVAFVIPTK
jgi:hypothetical protein